MLRYLFDENVDPEFARQLRRRDPDLTVWRVGEPGAPAYGTLDPEILSWREAHDMVLVTGNRRSMPRHLAEHLQSGQHVPGILVIAPSIGIGAVLDELHLIALAVEPQELADGLLYLPLT